LIDIYSNFQFLENHAQLVRHGRNNTVGGKSGGVGGYARESYEVELEIHRKAMALDVRSTVRGRRAECYLLFACAVRIHVYRYFIIPFFVGAK
jgi:hypothetical protein